MTTEFVLIRHGQTAWNAEGRMQGRSDTELNELGLQQAEALGVAMRGESWDVMASSPSKRAWATALPVAAAIGIAEQEMLPDPKLMERHYGIGEGMLFSELIETYPNRDWDGQESETDLTHRAVSVMEHYLERFRNNRIVLVTHGTWINHAIGLLSKGEYGPGISPILNTSRTTVTHDGNGWHVSNVSDASHLEALVN